MSAQDRARSFFLTSDFVVPTFAGALFFFVFHSFLLLPLRVEDLGGSPSDIGFIMGVSGVTMLLFTPLSGVLADEYGRKPFIVLGFFALFLACAGFIFLQNLGWGIYALRMLQGAAFSLFFTATGALITEITPEGKRVQAMGLYGMFTILGYAVAPYCGKIIIDLSGFTALFIVISIVCFLGAVLSFFVKDMATDSGTGKNGNGSRFLPPFSHPLALAVGTFFVSGWVFMSQFSFVSLSSRSIGIEDFYLFFVFFTAAVLFVRIFLGWAPDRYGIRRICPPFLFLAFASVLVLAFSRTPFSVSVSGALFGIAHGFTYPSLYLLAMEKSGNRSKAKVFALCNASFTSGGMLGTFVSGIVANEFDYLTMYIFLACMALAGFFAFMIALRVTDKAAIS
ncbi:MAG: MFS transporter [Candidatus Mycalebacterium zealandia]|nr:MAG: MFS transporter [Candidatus Mycalebacterium zealandia]